MLVRWVAGTNNSPTKHLIFLIISYRLRALKTLFIFVNLWEKNTLKPFLQRILQQTMKKNNTWNIRRLVDESFVPLNQQTSESENQQTSVLCCRLSDFKNCLDGIKSTKAKEWLKSYCSNIYTVFSPMNPTASLESLSGPRVMRSQQNKRRPRSI